MKILLWTLGFTALVLLAAPARTQTPPAKPDALALKPRPTQVVPMEDCASAGCHAQVKNFPVVHGPVNVDACEDCHQLQDPVKHTFIPTRQGAELCTFCHELDLSAPIVHQPVRDGQCLDCHNPHGSAERTLIRAADMRQLCYECHEDAITGKRWAHGPAASGACDACHKSHAAPFANLLATPTRDLCVSCHEEIQTRLTQVQFPHEAVEQGCTECHDPHASAHPMHLVKAPLELCAGCHEEVAQTALNSPIQHRVVTEGKACINCHTAHGGDLAKLLKDDPLKLCLSCHDKPLDAEGRIIPSMAEVLDPTKIKHGPILDGNCSGCHTVHGSQISRLLAKTYPAPFYQAYSAEKYELCFSCHDPQLVEMPSALGLTGFRNGSRNLHYLHVNKQERGRNCRACHSTHASSNPLHVRDTVPYGKWLMPINFELTETGGSCSPGCHKPFAYDRERPVAYDVQESSQ